MSIVKMKRVSLIGLDEIKQDLIKELMDYGMLEISDETERLHDETWANLVKKADVSESIDSFQKNIEKANSAIEVIDRYGELKGSLFSTRRHVSHEGLKRIAGKVTETESLIKSVLVLNSEIDRRKDDMNKLEQAKISLLPWKEYDLPLDLTETAKTVITTGFISVEKDLNQIQEELPEAILNKVSEDKENAYVSIITLKTETEDVLNKLKSYGFNSLSFKEFKGTACENISEIESKLDSKQKEIDKLIEDIKEKAKGVKDIEDYFDIMNIYLDREKAKSGLLKTEKTFMIEGWAPERALADLKAILEDNGCYYEFRDPEDDEEVPVLLQNPSFFRPTEAITEMYSLPAYRGFDPTSIYSLFYIIFFGIMFSDAGYGILMFLACFIVLKKFELEGNTYKMIKLFMYCGVSTAVFGFLFGGFFGDLISVFSSTFTSKALELKAIWFNPLDDPITFLAFSLILGVIHLFVGMGIQAYMQIKDGHVWDAICDEGFWYFTIVGLGIWLFGGMIGLSANVGMYLTIFGAAGLLLTGGRHKKGFGKITGGLSNLYNITSWMSDILSYARLLALGLATGVIAQVVNTMGAIFGGGVVGLILFVLIFIVGHLINFAINALGAFIHAARLQYVEFFGKFYIDGGEPFKPYSYRTKYIRITEE